MEWVEGPDNVCLIAVDTEVHKGYDDINSKKYQKY